MPKYNVYLSLMGLTIGIMLENRLILCYNQHLVAPAFSGYAEIPSAFGETSPYGGFAGI